MAEVQPAAADFVVSPSGRSLSLKPPDGRKPTLQNGDFSAHVGDKITAWSFQDAVGKRTFWDPGAGSTGSVRIEMVPIHLDGVDGRGNPASDARIGQLGIGVQPHTILQVQCLVRTHGFGQTSGNRFSAAAMRMQLNFDMNHRCGASTLPAHDHDWQPVTLACNVGNATSMDLFMGIWGQGPVGARVWFANCSTRALSVGLTNLVRRDGAPLVVSSADNYKVYHEGTDYDYIDNLASVKDGYFSPIQAPSEQANVSLPVTTRLQPGQN
eukprot:SAG22_NODE_5240_length_1055_cov_1.004184_1_plen_267_part_01